MKKSIFILMALVCLVSCEYKRPEVIVGTNTLTIGEETVIEVKHPRVRDIAFTLLHAEDSYLYFRRPYKKNNYSTCKQSRYRYNSSELCLKISMTMGNSNISPSPFCQKNNNP